MPQPGAGFKMACRGRTLIGVLHRHVSAWMRAQVDEGTSIALLITPRPAALDGATEELTITAEARSWPVEESIDLFGNRTHILRELPEGEVEIRYAGRDLSVAPVQASRGASPSEPGGEELSYLRASRYCEVEEFGRVADEVVGERTGHAAAQAVVDWVHGHLDYVPGSSTIHDSARSIFVSRQGVCRDFAHLTATLLRAAGIPARCTAVFAPGLSPMDFHLVVEAWIEGAWWLQDSTHLAPRASMLPIATGFDAADTAFMTTLAGHVELTGISVGAVVDPSLPHETRGRPVGLQH